MAISRDDISATVVPLVTNTGARFRKTRIAALIGTTFTVISVTFVTLSVGLIRSQETLHPDHSLAAYIAVFANPSSALLFAFGGVLSIAGFYKGMKVFSDPYPGYSDIQRAVTETVDDAGNLCEQAKDDIEELADAELRKLDQLEKQYTKKLVPVRQAKAEFDTALISYKHEVKAGESDLRSYAQHFLSVTDPESKHPIDVSALPNYLVKLNGHDLDALNSTSEPARIDFSNRRKEVLDAKHRALAELNELFRHTFDLPIKGDNDE